ncbi:MAG: SDR family oxidoreductase [Candidatus Tectomicrobia bacterium]|uniref:SDR family oxidoreductase n=1 Tax=Tectimicrobiota bacterium TaxID=2528274 RepID=A0A933GJP2_UNCTE|nr:SDR family oxidoreductase [Candidatus Tectomicrobia bacterium]
MDLGLKGKAAIVVASSKGLGKAVALGLAREGANLAICARGEKDLKQTAEEIKSATGVEVLFQIADVSQREQIKSFVLAAADKFGRIDILVNNAGGPPPGTFMDFSESDWLSAINLNLMSTIHFTRKVVPYMQKNRWGRIINITSVSVKQPLDELILSNTARAGVIGLAKSLANELAQYNILVNNVCPGMILTDRVRNISRAVSERQGVSPHDVISNWSKNIPLGRIGEPDELAGLVVFLASERASYITGTTIQIDGGYVKGIM